MIHSGIGSKKGVSSVCSSPTAHSNVRLMKFRKRALKRGAAILGLLAGIAALFCAEENIRGRLQLSALERQLRAQGEKLTPQELAPSLPPGSVENGEKLAAAVKELEALGRETRLVTDGPAAMKLDEPGRARVMFSLTAPEYNYKDPDLNQPRTWEELRRQLDIGREARDKAAAALNGPVAFPIDYTKGAAATTTLTPNAMRLVATLRSEILSHLHAGDLAGATDSLELLGKSWRLHEHERLLVPQVISVGSAAFSMDVVWEALQADGWSQDQLDRMQRSFTGADYVGRFVSAFEMERAMQSTIFDQLRESASGRSALLRMEGLDFVGLFADDDYSPPEPSPVRIWLQSHLWAAAWSHQDEARALRIVSRAVAATRELREKRSWADSPLRLRKMSEPSTGLDRFRFLLSDVLPGDAAASSVLSAVKLQTRCEALRTAIALKRYHLHHHRFPDTLASLVPDYLPAVPVDWMDGRQLRYRPTPGGSFLLYSVGLNGKDDGGDPAMPPQAKRISLDGRDTVWPRPSQEP